MNKRQLFSQQFRKIVLFCTLAGIYIPGFEVLFPGNPKVLRTILKCYSIFVTLCLIFVSVDSLVVLLTPDLALNEIFYALLCFSAFLWVYSVSIYNDCNSKRLKEIIFIWEHELMSSCMTKNIKFAVKKTTSSATIVCQTLILLLALPYFIVCFICAAYGMLFSPSYFSYEDKATAPLIISTIGAIAGASFIFRMVMFENLGWLILKLVILENELLIELMRDTNEETNVLSTENNEIQNLEMQSNLIRNNLKAIINSHNQLLIFSNKIKEMYGPIYIYEMGITTLFSTCITLCVASGLMPIHQLLDLLAFMPTLSLMIFTSCRHGHNIKIISERLGLEALGGNWMHFPIDVQKMVLMIVRITNKPTVISYHRLYPLDLQTYHSMMVFQYQLFNFVKKNTG